MIENNNYLNVSDKKLYIKKINDNLYNILQIFNVNKSLFSTNDLNDINGIIESLQGLEDVRFKAHEIWESESIKFEALRNKLIHYPIEITEEIERAIKAARGMNEETIRKLKETLEKINVNIDKYSNDLDGFNLENEILIPQFDQMKVKHEETVVILNQHLSRKADKQIELNEIRNTIKNYNENIVELEEDVFNLKEMMIKDRSKAREEKKRLLIETNKTQSLLDVQNQKNSELNKIYQDLKHEATETSMVVSDKLTANRKYVKTISEIKVRQSALEESIENTSWSNSQIKEEISETERKIIDSQCDFENWKSQMDDQIKLFTESVKMHEQIQTELHVVKEQAAEELEKTERIKDDVSTHLRSLLDKLKLLDEQGAAKVGDVGQLIYEMEEMERNIISSKENHEATVAGIKAHIASLKKQLEKERKERNEIQRNNSELQEQINLFRGEHMKFMREMNNKINDSKSENARLMSMYQQLKRTIKEELDSSEILRKSINEDSAILQRDDTELSDKISLLNRRILEMENEENEKRVHLIENEPHLKELQIYHEKHMKDFDKLKKDLVALKNRKSGLDDSINRATKSLEKENATLEKLKDEKQAKEEKLDTQLLTEAQDRSEIEKKIYVMCCKISTVKEEIFRLKHEINKMEFKTRLLRDNWESAIHISSKLKQDINGQKIILSNGWESDSNLEETFKNDEMSTIISLKNLLKSTEERQLLIADISDKLFLEIDLFDKFLSNMSTISSKKIIQEDKPKNQKFIKTIGTIGKLNSFVKLFDKSLNNSIDNIIVE